MVARWDPEIPSYTNSESPPPGAATPQGAVGGNPEPLSQR